MPLNNPLNGLQIDKLTQRKKPGWISARRNGNTFTLLSEGIAHFTLLLNPDEVDFSQPIIVRLNGKTIFNGLVAEDAEVLLKWAKNRDRTQLFTAELSL